MSAGDSDRDTCKKEEANPELNLVVKEAHGCGHTTGQLFTDTPGEAPSSGAGPQAAVGALSAGKACTSREKGVQLPSRRITRAQSKSPEPAAPPLDGRTAIKGSTSPAARTYDNTAAVGSSPAVRKDTSSPDELRGLQAALEAAHQLANTAMEGKRRAEERGKELQVLPLDSACASRMCMIQAYALSRWRHSNARHPVVL